VVVVARVPVFDTYNAAYVQAVFDQYQQNPSAVDPAWRRLFESGGAAGSVLGATRDGVRRDGGPPSEAQLRAARAAGELVDAFRLHGHRAAHLDPLGSPPPGHPMLDPRFHGITWADLETVPASMVGPAEVAGTIGELVTRLRDIYTGPIGYEYEYLEDPESREWLREQIESGAHRQPLAASEKRRLLERLTDVEAFEQFLHRAYLGAKRFSIEGTDMMVPMLDLAIERGAAAGAREVVIGMAHRGRLTVLAHVLGVPYADLIAKFEGRHALTAGTGDVKYHLGAEGTYATRSGEPLTVVLAPNPSHLEFVNPVVEGMTRAKQSNRRQRELRHDPDRVLPILIHGDAAFSGQGVVAETLNIARLSGYHTGGTLHIIANNQVGFTTDPREARSSDYASDLARGFDIPIFHVNADDPEACLAVVRLAMAFRTEFHSDVVIDLIGYRRYGHNEGDEPAYTQPVMYRTIGEHPTVRRLWAQQLAREGVLDEAAADTVSKTAHDRLVTEQERVRSGEVHAQDHDEFEYGRIEVVPATHTAVPRDRLVALDRQLHSWPEGFHVNQKLARQLERRARVVPEGGSLDWAHAEALAFASLLADGVPIRMSGQDSERGTFSQRHLVLHDTETGAKYTPMAKLREAAVSFEIYNSPLSELAALGFEYGFSVVAAKAVTLWEAQFGDFVNGAQVILDQFLVAGREKWGQESRLVLLLPHGYEGQGPEHSSARVERFLQLAAENNIRVANCTTPAQYFHLLRRQALLEEKRPLVVMTPKSLLRHPRAVSPLEQLTDGMFHVVLDDPAVQDRDAVRRVVLCSGKIFYDLTAAREKEGAPAHAIVRVEQLYPFPAAELKNVLDSYPQARELLWAQEEPRNMGAWWFMEDKLEELVGQAVTYVGRVDRASPAEGYAQDHETEQSRIVAEAMAPPASGSTRGGRRRSRQKAD
jgi:2-oxoglutarate dehydrogenase E1 component